MLAKLELWIEYEQEEKLTYNISSLMHGILMEQLDPIYGEYCTGMDRSLFIKVFLRCGIIILNGRYVL